METTTDKQEAAYTRREIIAALTEVMRRQFRNMNQICDHDVYDALHDIDDARAKTDGQR